MKKSELLENYIEAYSHTIKYFSTLVSEPVREFGLSFDQYLILHDIAATEDISLMTLVEKYKVTKGAISRQLKNLLTRGYIKQHRSDEDARRMMLYATDEGVKVDIICAARVDERFSDWIDILGEEDVKKFLSIVSDIDEKIMRAENHHDTAFYD